MPVFYQLYRACGKRSVFLRSAARAGFNQEFTSLAHVDPFADHFRLALRIGRYFSEHRPLEEQFEKMRLNMSYPALRQRFDRVDFPHRRGEEKDVWLDGIKPEKKVEKTAKAMDKVIGLSIAPVEEPPPQHEADVGFGTAPPKNP